MDISIHVPTYYSYYSCLQTCTACGATQLLGLWHKFHGNLTTKPEPLAVLLHSKLASGDVSSTFSLTCSPSFVRLHLLLLSTVILAPINPDQPGHPHLAGTNRLGK